MRLSSISIRSTVIARSGYAISLQCIWCERRWRTVGAWALVYCSKQWKRQFLRTDSSITSQFRKEKRRGSKISGRHIWRTDTALCTNRAPIGFPPYTCTVYRRWYVLESEEFLFGISAASVVRPRAQYLNAQYLRRISFRSSK